MDESSRFVSLSVFLVFALSNAALADGSCDGGMRPLTANEKSTILKLKQACKDALPPPPKGWVVESETKVEAPVEICKDYDAYVWRTDYSMTVVKTEGADQRKAQREKLIQDFAAKMKAQQSETDKIFKRVEARGQKLVAAAQAGNQAEIDRLNAEGEKDKALLDAQSAASNDALNDEEGRIFKDTLYSLSCIYNIDSYGRLAEAKDVKLAGSMAAFHNPAARDQGHEGRANGVVEVHAMFGKWVSDPTTTGYKATLEQKTGPAGQTLMVVLKADEGRFMSLLSAMKSAALAGNLKK
ncbi:MAG: hypothetical protein HY075_11360 [Deltaproteobacteria bacterium]|nr:hypothetical protein [Deltaproteobacteria bacterium]